MQGLDNMKNSIKFHSLPEYILNANLESPSPQNKDSGEDIKVSGWFLTKSNIANSDVKIVIKDICNDVIYEFDADIERQDVIDAILGSNHIEKVKPGFKKNITWSSHIQIFFEKNDTNHLWFEIFNINELDLESLNKQWIEINSIKYNSIEGPQLTVPQKKWLLNTCQISYDINTIINAPFLDQNEKNNFFNFIDRVNRWDFIVELCQYKELGYIRSCFDNSRAYIVGSLCVGNLNVIKIRDSSRTYYIFQNISSCDAIFIPDQNLLFCFSYVEHYQYSAFIENIHFFNKKNKNPSFGGYLTYYDRPYHYMYDMMLGYFYANTHGCFSDDDSFISKSGSDFLNLEKIFKIKTINRDDIKSTDDEYFIRIGINFGTGAKNKRNAHYTECLDRVILSKIHDEHHNEDENLYKVWFGITSQKRAWIEQADAIPYIINNLDVGNKKLCVIFDGWTSPLHKSDSDKKEILSDQKLVEEIISKVSRDIEIVNAIGLTIEDKIKIAKKIDFFVANYATGSLNVSRICKKYGIAHISNSFMKYASGQHIHPNAILVDPTSIKEIPSIYDVAHYSYSIKKEIIFSLIQKNIESI